MQNIKKNIILITFLVLVIFIFYYIGKTYVNLLSPTTPSISREEKVVGKITLEINDVKYESNISGQKTVSDFMDKLKEEGRIDFKEKNYTGMGKFIEEINGIKNSGEKNWIYYVNDKKSNIGISNYKINQGDIVSWKYEK